MNITRYNYTGRNKITAMDIDSDGNIWIGFAATAGSCHLYKVSGTDNTTILFDITVPVDEITKIRADKANEYDNDYIYIAVDDVTYYGGLFSITNPLGEYYYLTKDVSVLEKTVDIGTSDGEIYWITPGVLSGEIAKVISMGWNMTPGDTDVITDLTAINNARTCTGDSAGNLWILTYQNPIKLIRFYYNSGYTFTSWDII